MNQKGRGTVDAKVASGAAAVCAAIGVLLLIVGVLVYMSNAEDADHTCTCPEEEGGDECCQELHSLCDECWCTHSDQSQDGYCGPYESDGSHGGAGIGLAVSGLVVCVVASCILLTMRSCKDWVGKNLHVRYPAVTPADAVTEA